MHLLRVRRSRRKAVSIEGTSERGTTVRFRVHGPVSFCTRPTGWPNTDHVMTRQQYTDAPHERVRKSLSTWLVYHTKPETTYHRWTVRQCGSNTSPTVRAMLQEIQRSLTMVACSENEFTPYQENRSSAWRGVAIVGLRLQSLGPKIRELTHP